MATGRDTQLTRQLGEYLVAAELARRDLIATTFTGNIPHFDILAASSDGRSVPIQVKAIRGGGWQFDARKFVDIRLEGDRQFLGSMKPAPQPNLVCVFVLVGHAGSDRFFLFDWADLQRIVVDGYRAYLKSKSGVRPRKRDSYHAAVTPDHLLEYEDNWDLVVERIQVAPNIRLQRTRAGRSSKSSHGYRRARR